MYENYVGKELPRPNGIRLLVYFLLSLKLYLILLAPTADITTSAYVYEGKMHDYDIIVGRDLLNEIGIDLHFSGCVISCPRMHAEIPMKPQGSTMAESFYIADPKGLDSESERLSKILDSKYKPTDLYQYVGAHKKLTESQREQFLRLMQK